MSDPGGDGLPDDLRLEAAICDRMVAVGGGGPGGRGGKLGGGALGSGLIVTHPHQLEALVRFAIRRSEHTPGGANRICEPPDCRDSVRL